MNVTFHMHLYRQQHVSSNWEMIIYETVESYRLFNKLFYCRAILIVIATSWFVIFITCVNFNFVN